MCEIICDVEKTALKIGVVEVEKELPFFCSSPNFAINYIQNKLKKVAEKSGASAVANLRDVKRNGVIYLAADAYIYKSK